MSTMFGFKKYISAIAILTDFKKTVDIILCQQSETSFSSFSLYHKIKCDNILPPYRKRG